MPEKKAERPARRNWLRYFGKVAFAVIPRIVPGAEFALAPLTALEALRQERQTTRAQNIERSARSLMLRSAVKTTNKEVRATLEGRRQAAEAGRPIQAAPTVVAHRDKVINVLRRASLVSRQHALSRERPLKYAALVRAKARRRFELRKAA